MLKAAAFALGLSFVPQYHPPPESAPAGNLVFHKGYKSSFEHPASQVYGVLGGPECAQFRSVATLWSFTSDKKTVRAPADRKITIVASTEYLRDGGVAAAGRTIELKTIKRDCFNSFAFMVQAGHTYDVVQQAPSEDQGCPIIVTDAATGAAPEALSYGGCS